MQSPSVTFCKKKSIKLVLNYHGRPSSQKTTIIIMIFLNCCELLQIFGETGATESTVPTVRSFSMLCTKF